jgi:hypothetical protein
MARVSMVRPSPRAPNSRTLSAGAAHAVREGRMSNGAARAPARARKVRLDSVIMLMGEQGPCHGRVDPVASLWQDRAGS